MDLYDAILDVLDACPAGTVLEVWTREGERFEVEAEGGELRDWLPVESAPAPAHLAPSLRPARPAGPDEVLGEPARMVWTSAALAGWYTMGVLRLGVPGAPEDTSGDLEDLHSPESPSAPREVKDGATGGRGSGTAARSETRDAARARLKRQRGSATGYPCAAPGCDRQAETWALVGSPTHTGTATIRGKVATVRWSVNLDDYAPACRTHNAQLKGGGTWERCGRGHLRSEAGVNPRGQCAACRREDRQSPERLERHREAERRYREKKRARRAAGEEPGVEGPDDHETAGGLAGSGTAP